MDTNQAETRPIRNSPSVSSLSLSSKNLLSFSKLRKSTSKLSLQPSEPQIEAPRLEQQQAVLRKNHVGNRNSMNIVKQPSLRRKVSPRAHAPTYSRKRPSTAPSAGTSTQDSSSARLRRDDFPKPLGSSSTVAMKRMSNQPTTRSSLMQRFSRRPRRSNSSERAELPIQRVPSTRRQSIRVSTHRNSRAMSHRSSLNRPGSRRYSRPVSTVMNAGYQRPFSVTKTPVEEVYKEEDDAVSDFSTDSEEDAQIVMRGPRIERTRASAQLLPTLAERGRQTPSPIPASMLSVPNKSLADLIEELAGEIDNRGSRATMDSVLTWDLSLDHYCNAFPSPPSPGLPRTPQTPIFSESVTGYASLSSSRTTFTGAQERGVDEQFNTVLGMVATPRESSPSLPPLPEEEQATEQTQKWDDWHFPRRTSSVAYLQDGNATSPKQSIPPMPSISSLNHNQSFGHQSANSIASSLISAPTSPTMSTLARPRSVDRLAQARRRTRIIFGEVVDAVEGEEPETAACPVHPVQDGPPSLRGKASTSMLGQAYPSRRGSDKSSVLSSMGSSRATARGESEAVVGMRDDTFSLNSSEDDMTASIGVALTTETREIATPSPVAFAEGDENGLTLFARRKKRNAKLENSRHQLRVDPPPPVPPLPDSLPSTAAISPRSPLSGVVGDTSPSPLATHGHDTPPSYQQSYFPSRAGSVTTMHTLARTNSRTASPQPTPISAPSKRKSFFRYPFSSKRHSSKPSLNGIGHSKSTSISKRDSPPPPSPRAKVPPMSANPTRATFWSGRSLVGGSFSSSRAMKTVHEHQPPMPTHSPSPPPSHSSSGFSKQFRSFPRPSLSSSKRPLIQS